MGWPWSPQVSDDESLLPVVPSMRGRQRGARRIWRPSIRVVVTTAVILTAQMAQPAELDDHRAQDDLGRGPAAVESVEPLLLMSSPNPSGAEPPYPLNNTLDGEVSGLGSVVNADFETEPSSAGSPPVNFDLESEPIDVATVTNGDFEEGDFSGWDVTGSPTIESDPAHGYWARFGSGSQVLLTEALTIPESAQQLVWDVFYQSTGSYSWVDVYVLTGPTYATSTLLEADYCNRCGTWSTSYEDLSPYRGQSVKFKFRSRYAPVGIDAVRVQEVFPGFDAAGSYRPRSIGDDDYASLAEDAWLATDPFTLSSSAQFGTIELRASGTSSSYNVSIATGPTFGTWTSVSSGQLSDEWQAVSINVTAYSGQEIRLRVTSTNNVTWVDDVLASLTTDIPGWDPAGSAVRILEGSNHFVATNGSLVSSAIELPSDVQNVSFRLRSAEDLSIVYVELLRGPTFSEVVQLSSPQAGSTWSTVKYSLAPWAGETVKLRVRRATGSPDFHVDDAGVLENVLPGWQLTTDDAIATGQDQYGTYVTPYEPGGAMFLRSSWISTGIIDTPGDIERRYYALSFDIGASGDSLLQVFWVNEDDQDFTVLQTAASSPTGYRTRYFGIHDSLGVRGYFVVKITGGGNVYSIADNVARQHLSELFSRTVGDGIDTTTGAVGLAEPDLAVPGPIPLAFTRYYNSHSDALGPLGFRWSHTYDTRLVFAEDDVGVVYGSGREEFFRHLSGSFHPVDPRVHSSLVQNQDGTYSLTTKDNLTYEFSAQGRLTQILDLNDSTLELGYDGQDRLASVTGEGGVSLEFTYDGGRLSAITDPAGSTYSYAYDPNGDLISVTNPEAGVRTYTYNRHRLMTVTDELGNLVVSNAYDNVSRIVSQTDALGETIQVAHDTPGKGATQASYPDGGTATFYFDIHHRTSDTLDPSGRVTSFVFDSKGDLNKIIDSGNNEWDYAFDASADLTGIEDPLGNPISFDYNAKHLPVSVIDARGNETAFTYDAQGNMLTSTDPLDGVTTHTYDGAGNVLTVTDPLGYTTTYTYDTKGRKTSKTDPLGDTWTYTYTGLGKLETETDPLGSTTTYSYDLLGRLTSIEDPLERIARFTYDLVGHLLRVENPAGGQTTWDYDERGLVEAKIDEAGKTTTYTYDENRRMTSMTNPAGEVTAYGYDGAGRLTSITDALGNATAYTYDAEGRLALMTDPLGRETEYAYDEAGRLVEETMPNGSTIVYGYDPDGSLTSVADALERVTTNTYDELSRLVASTNPLGGEVTRDYDAAGRLTSVADPLGNTTVYAYDASGRLTSVTDALGKAATYAYDEAGRLTSVTDATDRITSYTYDDAGQLVAVTDPGGNTSESSFDLVGRLVSSLSPLGHETTYSYDPRGLLSSVTDPLGNATTYTFDDAGRLLTETDPLGSITTYDYDLAGRLTQMTDDLGGEVSFGYDDAGQLTSVTDPNEQTWDYDYNALGLRTSITDPLGRVTSFGYDAAGQLTSRTDGREITTSYGYDNAGQMTSVSFPGGETAFAYDETGRRTQMIDGTGTTTYFYDDVGRITSVGSPQGTIGYTYDDAGRRASMTLPGSRTVSYSYNPAGLLGSLIDWNEEATTFGYDAEGNRTLISRPNGVSSVYTYDAAGQVTDISHFDGGQELLAFEYAYDDAGRPVSVVTAEGAEGYTYDDLGRLAAVSYPNGSTVSYAYDPAGNRLSETRDGVPTGYVYDDAGQIVSVGETSYTYDAAGNLVEAGSDTFAWDYDSRLVSANVGAHGATYASDGDGRRVGATVDAASSSFLVDGENGLPTVVEDGTDAYVYAGGLLEAISGSQTRFPLQDRLGSIRGLTNGAGALIGTSSYEAFGIPRATSGDQSLFGFTGEPTDATGLVYLRARSLDPKIGRMLSTDSVIPNASGTQGYNLYAYAANNPSTWTDPTGHQTLEAQIVDTLQEFLNIVAQSGALISVTAVLIALNPYIEFGELVLGILAPIFLVFLVVAVVLFVGLLVAEGVIGNGSASEEGRTEWSQEQLEEATDDHPSPPKSPIPPGAAGGMCDASSARGNQREWFHGTDPDSALRLVNGAPLDASVVESTGLGAQPGFYLAPTRDLASYFATLHGGSPATIRYTFSQHAMQSLQESGAVVQGIPQAGAPRPFDDCEFFTPVSAFDVFNELLERGEIVVSP